MNTSTTVTLAEVRNSAGELLLEWARLLAPHYGATGSLDLDLRDWPGAAGPSFYNQFSPAALLLLADGIVPGAEPEEREQFRRLAHGNLDYSTSISDADFATPHYSRGRDWGRHIGEWLVYYQLEALRHLESNGSAPEPLVSRLRAVVEGATARVYADFKMRFTGETNEFPGNHAVWHGLLFAAAGAHFKRSEWMDFSQDFMTRHVLPYQDAAGCWQEANGIVIGYSLVTALAVSLYAELTDDASARNAVARAFGLHDHFFLPDASNAVVADVRMRRHELPSVCFPPGFVGCGLGGRLVLTAIERTREQLRTHGVYDNSAQAFAFFGSFCAWLFGPAAQVESLGSDWQPPATVARAGQGAWRGYLTWQMVPEWGANRFVLDSQNFIELWHDEAGYLAGTGNSKFMPRFSTLRRIDQGRAYVPDRASGGSISGSRATAHYDFGNDRLAITLTVNADAMTIAVRPETHVTGATYEFGLLLAFRPGEVIHAADRHYEVEPRTLIQIGHEFNWRGLRWEAPVGARVEYPIVPHNSYTQDGLPHPEDCVARLSFMVEPAGGTVRIQTASNSAAMP
jgi:hypothetical protein